MPRNTLNSIKIYTIVQDHMKDLHKSTSNYSYNDIILKEFITSQKHILNINHKLKYIQMKIGLVWQSILGNLPGVTNLGIGHKSSLDLMFIDKMRNKYIIELKNSYNTDNHSSRSRNIQKLGDFVKKNKDFIPIYGIINSKCGKDEDKIISFNNTNVRLLSGEKFLKFIFQNTKYKQVIKTLSNAIKPFTENFSK